jgi:drug/metabolite transporter (DMT)-like permease
MKLFNLFMAIMMTLITTTLILWILYTFEESNLGWGMLILVAVTGYLTSALYFYNHKQNTKKIG